MNEHDLKEYGVGIQHHFSSGVYAKQTIIPAGVTLTQHVHCYDHLSILASGQVIVAVDHESFVVNSPACLTVEKNKAHSVTAVTDSVWFCIHATDDENPETVDESILAAH